MNYKQYREIRRTLLEACCSTVKLRYPNVQHVVGIATEPGLDSKIRSEDAIYFDATNWTEENAAQARENSEMLDILNNPNPNIFSFHDYEYPI
jgi:hypothetical protein